MKKKIMQYSLLNLVVFSIYMYILIASTKKCHLQIKIGPNLIKQTAVVRVPAIYTTKENHIVILFDPQF